MKLQIFSDLHLDVCPSKPITIVEGINAVIVAGDTCEGALNAFKHLRRIVPQPIPILMVMGNHEYYRRFVPDELALARTLAGTFNVHLLENDTVILGGVRFIGATMWTDYAVFGTASSVAAMAAARYGLNDHRLIGWSKKPWRRFRPKEALLTHTTSRVFLNTTLAVPFAGPTVVVTHHGVHWGSVHSQFKRDMLAPAYVSDLSDTIEAHQPTLWVHGHVHTSFDHRVGETRIVCNAHGYWDENPDFDGRLVVGVAS